eukprot:3237269-Lingulodinium_polyedra.AAC.1
MHVEYVYNNEQPTAPSAMSRRGFEEEPTTPGGSCGNEWPVAMPLREEAREPDYTRSHATGGT